MHVASVSLLSGYLDSWYGHFGGRSPKRSVIPRKYICIQSRRPYQSRLASRWMREFNLPGHTYCWSPALIPKPKNRGRNVYMSRFCFLSLVSNTSLSSTRCFNKSGLEKPVSGSSGYTPSILLNAHDRGDVLAIVAYFALKALANAITASAPSGFHCRN